MHVIGVCSRKGGSGKTTTAVHLAAELAARGCSTELVDCDSQASATHWSRPGKLPMPVRSLPLESLDEVDAWSAAIRRLKADYVVIDSPPRFGAALGAVIGLSDMVVIPCGPSGLDLLATEETVGLVREIRQERDGKRPLVLLLPNRTDWRTSSGRELRNALVALGEPVAPELRARAALADAFSTGSWAGCSAAGSPARDDLRALASCALEQLGRLERRRAA